MDLSPITEKEKKKRRKEERKVEAFYQLGRSSVARWPSPDKALFLFSPYRDGRA